MLLKSRTRKLILNLATSVAILATAFVVLTPAMAFAQPAAPSAAQDDAATAGTAAPGVAMHRYSGR